MRRYAAAFFLALFALVLPAQAFSDVGEGDWYAEALDTLIADGILMDQLGQPFQSTSPVSRAEFLALVLRASDIAFPAGENWRVSCASAALNAGILKETYASDTLNRPISRYEAAEILWRALGSEEPSASVRLTGGITDEENIPARYLSAVRQCYLSGLFTGSKDNRQFSGETIVSRQEAVALILRLRHPDRRVIPPTEQISDFEQLLGECVTYTTHLADRNYNINRAANTITGTVLQPGEQFSFYRVVGNPGWAQGYRKAPAISGTSTFAAYGGGLCQNATTLFNAALRANLRIDERYCHSMKSNYIDPGYDATIYYGGPRLIDFKFTNTLSCPIRIDMSFHPDSLALTCQIYGASWVELPDVSLSTTGSGHHWTLYRKVDGVVNYTTKSSYQN